MRVVAFLLTSLITVAAFAAEYTIPNFQDFVRAQETRDTCWAASNRMLLASKGIEVSEESQLRKVFGSNRPRGAGRDFSRAQQGLTGSFAANDGSRYRVRPYVSYRFQHHAGDGEWIVNSLHDDRPIVTTDGQHGYVIYGAQWQERGGQTYITGIRVIDPLHQFDPDGHPRCSGISPDTPSMSISSALWALRSSPSPSNLVSQTPKSSLALPTHTFCRTNPTEKQNNPK